MLKRSLAGCVLGLSLTGTAFAQQEGPPPPPNDNNGGGPPNFAEMRQRMTQRMKEELGVDDKEWATLEPKIDAVRQAQRDAGGMRGPGGPPPGGRGPGGPGGSDGQGRGPGGPPPGDENNRSQGDQRRGGPPPQDQNRQPSVVEQKNRELMEAVENGAKPEEIKAKLEAVRAARAEAKEKITKAQGELKELVTTRQEAVLVRMGILE